MPVWYIYGLITGVALSIPIMAIASFATDRDRDNKYAQMVSVCEKQSVYQCELKAIEKGKN